MWGCSGHDDESSALDDELSALVEIAAVDASGRYKLPSDKHIQAVSEAEYSLRLVWKEW